MRLQITHETRYDYAPPVVSAQHLAYLQPVSTAQQQLIRHTLDIHPPPAQMRPSQDIFGNQRCYFSIPTSHAALQVLAHSEVLTTPSLIPTSRISWEQARVLFQHQRGKPYEAAHEFVFASPLVPRHAEFAHYAQASFPPGLGLLDAACDLMRRIHRDFLYESQSTQVNTPVLEALMQRRGVCQDFAHILIACLRAMGLPARYVSGYLLTVPAPGTSKLRGADASHAWASVYLPDLPAPLRWCDLDPTNNRVGWPSPGEDYVTLASGRDFSDVSPIRGVIQGNTRQRLTVGVTVEPVDPS